MRVLFTAAAASGHLHPLVPLAQALAGAGHEVGFVSGEPARPWVEQLGFLFFPGGLTVQEAVAEVTPLWEAAPDRDRPLWREREAFCRILPERMLPDLLAACREWPPDVIVREATEFGGALAAEFLGLPHASVEVGGFFAAPFIDDLGGVYVDRIRAGLGLPPDPGLAMLYRHLHLSFVPTSFQDPAQPLPASAVALRTVVFDRSGEEALPAWVAQLPDQPIVYATLGTVFNGRPELFRAIVAGLGALPINLIVTVGRDGNPAALGPQPGNVRIERYVPQSLLFPHCDLVVCHGGWSTTLGALAHGLPLVLLPLGADQPWNAERCRRLGVGRVLGDGERSAAAIRAAVRDLLDDGRYRANAAKLRAEMAALPGPERAVALLEDLVAAHRPPPTPGERIAPILSTAGPPVPHRVVAAD